MIMGDFNIDLLKYEEHQQSDEFINALGTYSFQPYILQPTRITYHSETLIDNIFFNSIDHDLISGNLIYDISDHLPNFLLINNMSISQCRTDIYSRDYSKLNEIALCDEIKILDWKEILSHCHNSDDLFNTFHSTISGIIDKHIPLRKLSRKQSKQQKKPWITTGIRTAIKKKNKLFKSFIRTSSNEVLAKLKLYRNKLNHLIKLSKRNYYNNYFTTTKPKRVQPPPKITVDGVEITDITKIANEFNVFFCNIGYCLANNIRQSNTTMVGVLLQNSTTYICIQLMHFECNFNIQ